MLCLVTSVAHLLYCQILYLIEIFFDIIKQYLNWLFYYMTCLMDLSSIHKRNFAFIYIPNAHKPT